MDAGYADLLLQEAQYYELKTKTDSADTVDAIQIFETSYRDSHLDTVDEVRANKLIYESEEREFIDGFFRAARRAIKDQPCGILEKSQVLHILAFDRDLMRVAYFKYTDCQDQVVGAIGRYGAGSIVLSSELATLLRPLRTK
jgi:hypothetical protein